MLSIFKKRRNYRKILTRASTQLATAVDINDLASIIFETLEKDFSIPSMAFYLVKNFGKKNIQKQTDFIVIKSQNFLQLPQALPSLNPLLEELESKKEIILKKKTNTALKKEMEKLSIDAAIPCLEEKSMIAFLILAGKPHSYDSEEIDLLKIISAQMMLVLERIKPYEQIQEDLKKTLKTAEERARLAALATLIQGLAHELRNPLAILLSRAELVRKQIENKESVLKFADMTIRNIVRLLKLIETMLHFGSKVSHKETVDINSTIEDILLLTEGDCGEKEIKVIKELNAKRKLKGGEAEFNEAFLNLALNAIQAMELSNEKILTIKTRSTDNAVEIIISDTGHGIKKDNLALIYNPFFTTKPTGCGLGLSITKKIIEGYKGTLEIKSKEGKGTTATLTFPLQN